MINSLSCSILTSYPRSPFVFQCIHLLTISSSLHGLIFFLLSLFVFFLPEVCRPEIDQHKLLPSSDRAVFIMIVSKTVVFPLHKISSHFAILDLPMSI